VPVQPARVIGTLLTVAFTLITLYYVASLTASYEVLTPLRQSMQRLIPALDVPLWFWSYRWFDVVFLILAAFATIAGLAALFGAEPSITAPEEAVTEGYKEEAMEEEE